MFGSELRNFNAALATVDDFLIYTVHFIAEYERQRSALRSLKIFQACRMLCLLHSVDCGIEFPKGVEAISRIFKVRVPYGGSGAQCSLIDLAVWRSRCNAAREQRFTSESIHGSEK